jgi:hypothetical protein
VLGIILPDRTLAYADRRYRIDSTQAEKLRQGPLAAEKRYRFASSCAQSGCMQWSGGKCGVIEEVLDEARPNVHLRKLPECSIRSQCRWFSQRGEESCFVCPFVVTDGS